MNLEMLLATALYAANTTYVGTAQSQSQSSFAMKL